MRFTSQVPASVHEIRGELFAAAPPNVRWLAHAAHLTALDREEHAACAYQRRVDQVAGS